MNAIDNSGLLNVCYNCGNAGFIPGLTYAFVTATKILTITDTSTIPGTDGLKVINVMVTDRFGNQAFGKITTAGGNVAINLTSNFNVSKGFNISTTVVTNNRVIADLTAYGVANPEGSIAGTLGNSNVEDEGVEP